MRKEGAVNKKRQKWCAESEQWIHFSQWKKHKAALAQLAKARVVQQQDNCLNVAETWNPLQDKLRSLERENSSLRNELSKKNQVLNGYRETLGSAGRLLASLVDVSEIN
jgi:hypothetical protein